MKRRRQITAPPVEDDSDGAKASGSQHSNEDGRNEAGYRSSWHGPITELEKADEASALGVATRSCSQGNLLQKSKPRPRLKFFKRQSYTVNPSPPSSPSKSAGLKSLFHNMKRSRKTNENESTSGNSCSIEESPNKEIRHVHSTNWNISTESDSSIPEVEPIRTCPDIDSNSENEETTDSESKNGTQVQNESDNQVMSRMLPRSQSDNVCGSQHRPPGATIPRSNTHPIHTFQCRGARPRVPAGSSLFSRTRARKSVIAEVEENLTHPVILVLLSVINFTLWMFLFTIKVLRISARISVWLCLKVLYLFDFFLRLFYRIFNQDPEKVNQNSDYTHIESKYMSCLVTFESWSVNEIKLVKTHMQYKTYI